MTPKGGDFVAFWDFLRGSIPQTWFTPRVTYINSPGEAPVSFGELSSPANMTVGRLWATQPHLRTVVTFRARNVAQLGLHVFERVSDADRRRDHTSPLARALRRPDLAMTTFDLIFSLVGDLDLYDRAYWLILADPEDGDTPLLRRLPPSWVEPIFKDPFTVKKYRVARGDSHVDVDPAQVLAFTGYAPGSPIGASPTVEALKDTLREQIEAAAYRAQVWKRGGRVSAVLERPKDAPAWSNEAREQFREDWYAKFTGRGPKAGGTPILEDGMTLRRIDFNAQEQQFVDVAKLALATVASSYHVNPTMIGLLDNANYSNVREFRRMLYGDTLGPLLAQIEARINAFLIPALGMDPERYYAEFNLQEKLQGSFEEQAAVMSTMVGRPIMTADEARGRFNLPALGGDAERLVTPLNVLVGGQASSRDSGSQNRVEGDRVDEPKAVHMKARAPKSHETRYAGLIADFFARQSQSVRSRIGAGRDDWWDEERWDAELSADLVKMYANTSEEAARTALEGVGLKDYDVDRTLAFLTSSAALSARDINAKTRGDVASAMGSDDSDGDPVGQVFETAESQRAGVIAATVVTFASGFGVVEAARQNSDAATKTWRVTSTNPRDSHARMDGETVGIDDVFSNGLRWPGGVGDPDETAGCRCAMDIDF